MSSYNLLIIDDDLALGKVLQEYLEKYSHKVTHAGHPNEGIEAVKEGSPDLIILDIMMPDKDGLEVCREIRNFSDVPIIFLSARGDTTDRIVGLEIGGDDYLPKPFEPRELLARIDSILRRASTEKRKTARIVLEPSVMQVYLDGQDIELTPMEFKAFSFLFKNKSRIVTREELINHVQGMDIEVFDRSIDILISRLRAKLGEDSKNPQFIKTIRGQGYRYIEGGR